MISTCAWAFATWCVKISRTTKATWKETFTVCNGYWWRFIIYPCSIPYHFTEFCLAGPNVPKALTQMASASSRTCHGRQLVKTTIKDFKAVLFGPKTLKKLAKLKKLYGVGCWLDSCMFGPRLKSATLALCAALLGPIPCMPRLTARARQEVSTPINLHILHA